MPNARSVIARWLRRCIMGGECASGNANETLERGAAWPTFRLRVGVISLRLKKTLCRYTGKEKMQVRERQETHGKHRRARQQ